MGEDEWGRIIIFGNSDEKIVVKSNASRQKNALFLSTQPDKKITYDFNRSSHLV